MTPDELAEWIRVAPWLVAAVIIGLFVVWVVRKIAPSLKKLTDMADDFLGEKARPGVPARPGVMERLAAHEAAQDDAAREQGAIADKLEVVRHELFPNSGTSLRDAVNRIDEKLDSDNRRIGDLEDGMKAVDERVTEAIETIKEHHP